MGRRAQFPQLPKDPLEAVIETARDRTGRRDHRAREDGYEIQALMSILKRWEEEPIKLGYSKLGGILKARVRIVVEEYLEELLERLDRA